MLFEFDKYNVLSSLEERETLESSLIQIWQNRYLPYSNEIIDEISDVEYEDDYQPFLKFDGKQFRPRNYIGFIYSNGNLIEIYPKVFKNSDENDKINIIKHLFYWFNYCNKISFPFLNTPLDNMNIDRFPELIIFLFSKSCHEILSSQPYSRYEEISEVMNNPKGRIEFSSYVSNSISRGNYHLINCNYEPFVYDNKLNRAIKYVCRLLINQSRLTESQYLLQEILYILDEVEDIPCRASELEQLKINPLFTDYKLIIDWCIRFLEQQLYSPLNYDSFQWALLLPMEYIFEDFVVGFLKKYFGYKYKIYPQRSELYLSNEPKAFKMKHDILLINRENNEQIIIDTKYKPRWDIETDDTKEGVSQADMYQMVSYAYRRGCKKVILLYPNVCEEIRTDKKFIIKSGFNEEQLIYITIAEIPFWSLLDFENIETKIKDRITDLLDNI